MNAGNIPYGWRKILKRQRYVSRERCGKYYRLMLATRKYFKLWLKGQLRESRLTCLNTGLLAFCLFFSNVLNALIESDLVKHPTSLGFSFRQHWFSFYRSTFDVTADLVLLLCIKKFFIKLKEEYVILSGLTWNLDLNIVASLCFFYEYFLANCFDELLLLVPRF